MRTWTVLLLLIGVLSVPARAEEHEGRYYPQGEPLEVKPNAYGLGVNSDQYGRPHDYRTPDGAPVPGILTDGVRRDAYGPGVHADDFGRALRDGKP